MQKQWFKNHQKLIKAAVGGRRRPVALALLGAALKSIEPSVFMPAALSRIQRQPDWPTPSHLLAIGKAAHGMAKAALHDLRIQSGHVLALHETPCPPLQVHRGTHPLPANDAVQTARTLIEWAQGLGEDDHVVCLISGGASSLLCLPAPGIQLKQIQTVTDSLMKAGAPIGVLNAVRRHLSGIKGGKLAHAFFPAAVTTIVLSDVPGLGADSVGSGPTVPLPEKHQSLLEQSREYGVAIPALKRDGSPDPHQTRHPFAQRNHLVLAGSNETAQQALIQEGKEQGLRIAQWPTMQAGVARDAGAHFYREAMAMLTAQPGLDGVVCGGETTVTVRGHGTGGRVQEWLLGAARIHTQGLLAGLATDGADGSSHFAGGLIDRNAIHLGGQESINDALEANDSASWFRASQSALDTGHTGTNVADIGLLLR